MSSWTEPADAVVRGDDARDLATIATPELRGGSWTRLGDSHVLGDLVTEQVLAGLAESARTAARAQGYAVGWAEGRREAAAAAVVAADRFETDRLQAESRRESEHRAALDGLVRAAAEFQRTAARLAADLEDQGLRLARELTTEIVGHELRSATDPAADVVRRAVAVLPTGAPVTLRVHPSVVDAEAVADLAGHDVRVVADHSLERHDAVVETEDRLVDLRVGAALERVREVLS